MGSTREQNTHLHTFLCCPHEQPKEQWHRGRWEQNSHSAPEQPTPLVPFASLPSSCFNTLGPKPMVFRPKQPVQQISCTGNSCAQFPAQNPLFLSYIHNHGTFQGIFPSQKQSESPVPATKQPQHFCRTLSFVPCGHRSGTCSEPTVPSWMQCWRH